MKLIKLDSTIILRLGAIGLALLWLYSGVLTRLVSDWWVDENYSHGFLIPLISGYALWVSRHRLVTAPQEPRLWLGGLLVLVAVLMLLAGIIGAEFYISRISFVVAIAGLVIYFFGLSWLRRLMFPLGLFLLAIPIPTIVFNQVAFPLQLLASDYAARTIGWLGIPALREGNVIELAHMKLQVVEACSGIRSLMALATLAVTYVYFSEPRWWRRLVLLALVIPIAIATNAARVAGTGIMAHYYGIAAAKGFMHSFSGWLVFVTALLLFLVAARGLSLAERLFKRPQRDLVTLDQFDPDFTTTKAPEETQP